MFDYSNCQWLEPDIMDVVRLFNAEDEHFGYHFEYSSNGTYHNCIEYQGQFYDYENTQFTQDEVEYKRYAKRFAKLAFYNLLSQAKGIKMPYGALTGVRPTKLAYMESAAGRNFEQLFHSLGVSPDNIKLVKSVLKEQEPFMHNKGGQDLFISLPFCPTKCEYCSFITAPISSTRAYVDSYISCLEREIKSVAPLLTKPKSIYIGGGTPFAIETEQLKRVYAAVKALNIQNCEYTVEAGRPDTFTEEKLKITKDFGVTRICINPQSFSDKTLQSIGRKHTCADVYAAFELAEKYNFDINVDLIAGLSGETVDDFKNSLTRAIELDPANITVHTLSLKAGAKLKENCSRLQIEGIGAMLALSREMLGAAGYAPYYMYRQKYQAGGHENCGWCKPRKQCVYNIDVMEEIADNIAVGANAISKKIYPEEELIERLASPKDIKTYIAKTDKIIADRIKLFT